MAQFGGDRVEYCLETVQSMKRPLITIVSHYAASIVNFRGALIHDLIAAGCDVSVLAPDWTAEQQAAVTALGASIGHVPVSRMGLNIFNDLRTFFALLTHFRQSRPRVVFTYSAKTNVWGILAAAVARTPRRVAMVEGMGYAFTEGPEGRRTFKQRMLGRVITTLYRAAFKFADRVVVLNPDDLRELESSCGLPHGKALLLGGIGIDLKEWSAVPPHCRPLTFTFVGRMLREKGVFEFLSAAKVFKARHPETRFLMLGDVDTNPGAIHKSELEAASASGTIQWPGQVDIKPWLSVTSVFVLPSYREGVPRSSQEAMALGRPVITTDVPGCRETVVEGVNGFLVPARDVHSLVGAMERFIENPQLIESMGAESRRLAEERFDVRVVNRRLLEAMGVA